MESNWFTLAQQIFYDYVINQSVTIKGFENEVPVGELVCKELERLDVEVNCQSAGEGRPPRRKRYKPPNTIGGFVEHKIFKWKQEIRDKKMVYTIWRIQ